MPLTPILIRAAARGGKFLGTDAGGARFWVLNQFTGESYAVGQVVNGDSGPPSMMTTPMLRDKPLPVDSQTAGLFIQPHLDKPTVLYIFIEGPLLYPSQTKMAATWALVLPGVGTIPTPINPTQPPCGLVIEIPGICIDVKTVNYEPSNRTLAVTAEVMMMCGCKVGAILPNRPTSPWPSDDFDVQLVVSCGAQGVISKKMKYIGMPTNPAIYSIFEQLPAAPDWAMIIASQTSMGQSGCCAVLGNPPIPPQASAADMMAKPTS